MADAIEKVVGYAGRNKRAHKKRLRSAVGHFVTEVKGRGRPRIRTPEYWREYYTRKQREWRAAQLRTKTRRKKQATGQRVDEESLFVQQNDYWSIRYDGHAAVLRSTRGLHYLAILLRNPGCEFHVAELHATVIDMSAPGETVVGNEGLKRGLYAGVPVLDAKAKAELKSRLSDLRQELNEAEQFNDSHRKTEAQNELQAIAEYLASAVGVGGRDRKTSSDAERARSAVTKCIKKAIQKIGDAIPSLGCHLAARIKTGYFCSYNPHPDRQVAWKF